MVNSTLLLCLLSNNLENGLRKSKYTKTVKNWVYTSILFSEVIKDGLPSMCRYGKLRGVSFKKNVIKYHSWPFLINLDHIIFNILIQQHYVLYFTVNLTVRQLKSWSTNLIYLSIKTDIDLNWGLFAKVYCSFGKTRHI